MSYYVTTPEHLELLASAVNALCGLGQPVRGTVVGGPDFLPTEYTGIGTPGWTDCMFRGSWVSSDLAQAAISVAPEMLTFADQIVVVGELLVEFPSAEEQVEELPASLLPENGAFWWNGETL